MLGEFGAAYPGIRLRLLIRDSTEVLQSVEEGRVELGFAGARRRNEFNLLYEEFALDRLVLVAPAEARWSRIGEIGLDELMREPLLMREPGSGTRVMFERRLEELGRSVQDLNVVAELGSTSAITRGVQSGLGLAVVSHLAIAEEVESGRLKVLDLREMGRLERRFFVVTHRTRTRSPLGQVLATWLAARREGSH